MRRFLLFCLWCTACKTKDRPLFRLMSPSETGIHFANTITTDDSINVQSDVYVYNGAGVAVGDIDNDGLPDVFLSGNQVSSRLYRNTGNFHFDDVTDRAHVATTRWASGATMVDINGDGWLDIYVSVSGHVWTKPADRANLLFVNNHDGTFTESAAKYGVADSGFTTQSVFLDYDRDGCIDLFVLNNSPEGFSRAIDVAHPAGVRGQTSGGNNELYHNNCNGSFTSVSAAAGIIQDAAYGLGVVVTDFNRDGWPDLYVSNDATPNDVLYINNRNGTFTNRIDWLKRASFAGMGVDAADFNNDGWPDIMQSDMMPHDLVRRKRMSGQMTYNSQHESRGRGFRDDYSQNSLQLSNGADSAGNLVFSEIARMAGVAATDWSWTALFADFDNDGWKDILITNGYPKAVNDFDYQSQVYALNKRDSVTQKRLALAILEKLPGYEVDNYLFRNRGDLTFEDMSAAWGFERPGYSYGAAYADLDNDGRLDLVINNLDGPASIYRNTGGARADSAHYLQVRLRGSAQGNRDAIGAEVAVVAGGQRQFVYYSPYRGYMSSVDERAHFGLGTATRVDSVIVTWPDGAVQALAGIRADTSLTIQQGASAAPMASGATFRAAPTLFRQVGSLPAPPPPNQVDYAVQALIPYMVSRQGPALAVGDVNGDGVDDVFIGGGGGVAGRIFLGNRAGFTPGFQLPATGSEDWGATFFDANGDGRLDLYVSTGGYFESPGSPALQDRLYINRGGGRFSLDPGALPDMRTSTGVVRAADFNGDGRVDLFVAGRLTPRAWPLPTRSYILRNDAAPDGGARFTDVTADVAPELLNPGGMVTDAQWVDYDGDGRVDLVTVGEWMPIHFLHNDSSRFSDATANTGLPPSRGWWYSLAAADIDHDGRPDLLAGNFGMNSMYAPPASPLGVYAGNFGGSGSTDVILTTKVRDTTFTIAGLVPLGPQFYTLGLRFPAYGPFARATAQQVFGPQLASATHYEADTFRSTVVHNDGNGRFSVAPLPAAAQMSPMRGVAVVDVDGDGALDVVVAGNIRDVEANTPRWDAGNGLILRGNGRGAFTPLLPRDSGFLAPLDVSGLAITRDGRVLVANIGAPVQVFGKAR